MIVVTGATGSTGQVVAERLLEAGEQVKVISRSAERLEGLTEQGALPAVGNLEDGAFVKRAFRGAKAVYIMIPPKFDAEDFRAYQRSVAEHYVQAVRENQVPYVVTLSSYGAHAKEGLGVVSGLYPMEQGLNAIEGTHLLHLRAGYFYDNLMAAIPLIREQGILGGFPIDGEVAMAMVHAPEIGATAAEHLSRRDFTGHHVVFLGHEQAYTLQDAATVLGKAIGKEDLQYVAFPAEGAREAMVSMGMSESLADQYIEFSQGVNEGLLYAENDRYPQRYTATSLDDFASIFAAAYAQDR